MLPITVGVLTISDSCNAAEKEDTSGENLKIIINSGKLFNGKVVKHDIVGDVIEDIRKVVSCWYLEDKLNLVITTGGTGLSPRDVTPQAIKTLIDKDTPGITMKILMDSLKVTPLAALSRPVCGVAAETLIITLPGSKKASEECLTFAAPVLGHAIDLILNRKPGVSVTHDTLQAKGAEVPTTTTTKTDQSKCHSHSQHQINHHPHHNTHHCHSKLMSGGHHHHHQHQQRQQQQHQHEQHHHHHNHSLITSGNSNLSKTPTKSKADVSKVSRRPRKSPYPMISVDEAQEKIFSLAERMHPKSLAMMDSLGYVLAENIYAKDPLPPFRASIKDGYAVLVSDGTGIRKVVGDSIAGSDPLERKVMSGVCIRVNTGAPVPDGADAVVQVEDTELVEETDDGCDELKIEIKKAPSLGQDIRPIGCDIAVNQEILSAGTVLDPPQLGLLASVGVSQVLVYNKPTVAVLSTGNELQVPGTALEVGHIYDSNKTLLLSLLAQNNFTTNDVGISPDDPDNLMQAIHKGLQAADILVTTGCVSMGEKDILRTVLEADFGAIVHFAQVFMKPGKPTTFATCMYNGRQKLILGLPGNPVSATVTSHLYILPLCRKISGCNSYLPRTITAKLSSSIILDPRPEYHRATIAWMPDCDVPIVETTGNQQSSRLLSFGTAQTLLKLPPATLETSILKEGTSIQVIILNI